MKTILAIFVSALVPVAWIAAADAEPDRACELLAAAAPQGLAVQIGCGPSPAAELAALQARGHLIVQGLDADPANVEQAREAIRAAGICGPISVIPWTDPKRLPYADNLVNLLVVRTPSSADKQEIWRVPRAEKHAVMDDPAFLHRGFFNHFPGRRLYTTTGLLDGDWHRRMYWAYGQVVGQYIVFRGEMGYAVRVFEANSREGGFNSGEGYVILAGRTAQREMPGEKLYALPTAQSAWRVRVPLRPQALAGGHLLVAGPPDTNHPRDALGALDGQLGGVLWILSAADGRKVAEWKLEAPPIYDGLAVAGGCLYFSGTDGQIRCWAEAAE